MLVLSALKKYPFLDVRTSTFLFAITVVVAAIGIAGLGLLVRPWLRGGVAAMLAAAAAVAFIIGAQPYVRIHSIVREDVRDQARYIAAHAAPGDVILVNLTSNWGFAYYWPAGTPARRADPAVLQGYEAYFPGQPRIIVARARDRAGVSAALSLALARARQHACARIWLVRTHLGGSERAAWAAALRQRGLVSMGVRKLGLRVVQPSRGSAGGPARCPGGGPAPGR